MDLLLISVASIFLSFVLAYIKSNYYVKAYYLSKNREFKGMLKPYMSIPNLSEMLLLIPYVPYLLEANNNNIVVLTLLKSGNKYNKLSILFLIVGVVLLTVFVTIDN